uniref:Venom redulysin 11 n=1 Tax=Oncocephalus sp. TaxID=2944721 RepID=A0AB38ZEF9_9HEMI
MSKLWLLLLLVAAFQFVHAHPAEEYEVDEFASDEAEEYLNDEPQMSDEEETDYLEDGEDEERGFKLKKIKPGKIFKKTKDGLAKAGKKLKQLGKKAKDLAKKGAKMLKDLGVTITPLKCEDKKCQSCIGFKPLQQSCCIVFVISRTQNKNLYLTITAELNGKALFTPTKLRIGEVPKCLNAGDFMGKFCMKGFEAHAKSSEGKPHLHFCVVCFSEKLNMGVKLCASYINKKMDLRVSPKFFPAVLSDDGEIVKVDEATDEAVVVEDEGEFEDLDF